MGADFDLPVGREREARLADLQALLEIQASRTRARTTPNGRTVLLEAQDRRLWDQVLISRGFDALGCAEELGGPLGRLGPRRRGPGEPCRGARACVRRGPGLRVLDGLGPQALPRSHLLPAVRGDLLARAGRAAEAATAFRRAATLTRNESERAVLLARADESS